jgi:hypothetical protein
MMQSHRFLEHDAGHTLESAVRTRYARDGWAAVPGFFSPETLAEIDRFTDETEALPEVAGA